MTDGQNTELEGAQGAQQNDGAEQQTEQNRELTNRDVKNDPLFIKMATRVAELERAEKERLDAAEKSKREAEIKRAQEEQRYNDAIEMQKAEHDREIGKLRIEIRDEKLLNGLQAVGFDPRGAKVLIGEYDAETHGEIDAYVKACFENDDNKVYLRAPGEQRQPAQAPPTVKVGGGAMTAELAKEYELSGDPEKEKKAREWNRAYRAANNGKWAYHLD